KKETTNFKSKTTIEKEKEAKVDEFKSARHFLYTDTILDRPDPAKPPTKVKRFYDKAQADDVFDGKAKPRPYEGKTVLIEKKGDKYEFRIEGGAAIDADGDLTAEFTGNDQDNQKKLFVPPGPVALNAPWKADPKALLGDLTKEDATKIVKSEGT